MIFAFKKSAYVFASSYLTPVLPDTKVRRRKKISALTTSASIGAPTPAAWDLIKDFCNSTRSFGSINLSANAPKPVETP